MKKINKFKKIKYNTQNDAGYVYLKTLTKLAATFADQAIAQDLLNSINSFIALIGSDRIPLHPKDFSSKCVFDK